MNEGSITGQKNVSSFGNVSKKDTSTRKDTSKKDVTENDTSFLRPVLEIIYNCVF